MISLYQAVALGLLQGVTELFPISSLGHSIVLPEMLGWQTGLNDHAFLIFLVGTHFATATVLFFYFLDDWIKIIKGIFRTLVRCDFSERDPLGKLGWLLVAGTVPAGLLGLVFQEELRGLFASPRSAAFFLFLNGLLLFGAEWLRRRRVINTIHDPDARLAKLTFRQAIVVGTVQALALFPGLSRSGASMGGGLLVGLSHEDAARYSFLLATPIIGAAALLKLPHLFLAENQALLLPTFIGAVSAGVTAWFTVRFLMKYFHTNTLTPFAVYCTAIGLILSGIFQTM
ncbi:undecaprenyl-diphosphate phosphatase [Candidatus Peregrinibacteria bacterium]|nr:undecaprenyl-diphosphate phosphatase [Candidatus Peregrinibacteria bacterium]